MDENSLRCPQCGSPVLQTANYCVICGIRLPDPAEENDERAGWESARSSNDPIAPVPPIEIPEFDDPADDESTIDIEAAGGVDETYDPIPDIELDELDQFIAEDQPDSDEVEVHEIERETPDSDEELVSSAERDEAAEPDGPEIESDEDAIEMIDEGAPAFDDLTAPASGNGDESERDDQLDGLESDLADLSFDGDDAEADDEEAAATEVIDAPADPEASDMIEEGAPVFDSPITSPRTEAEVSEIEEPANGEEVEPEAEISSNPAIDGSIETGQSDATSASPDDAHVESDNEAIEMIDEGGPAFDDETAPLTADEASPDEASVPDDFVASDDAETSSYQGEQPMISASYPESAIEGDASYSDPNAEHWWPEDNDDDWVYFEAERSGAMSIASTDESSTDPSGSGSGEQSLERARALIRELDGLLPMLTTPGEQPIGVDLSELRAQAIAARGERSFDDWAALRQAIGTAAGRPTDIETILQLSKRVDDIAALIVERDRLHDAFQHVIEWIDNANER